MSNYNIAKISPNDRFANSQIEKLLQEEGIRRDPNLDYTCGMYDEDMNIIATGSLFGNTLRCMAVSHLHQGEGLMNEIVTHLIEIQFERGNTHLFLYTKCDTAKFFGNLGFSEIARVSDQLVFMENKRTGFSDYLKKLQNSCPENAQNIAALVMNANPFTNGHLYLVKKAAAENALSATARLRNVHPDASTAFRKCRNLLIRRYRSISLLSNKIYSFAHSKRHLERGALFNFIFYKYFI